MIAGNFTEGCDFYRFRLITVWHVMIWSGHSSRSELKFFSCSNPTRALSDIYDSEK